MNQGTNHPPVESLGPVAFTLTRASGEIEIRARSPEHLWAEQLKHPDYKFEAHSQFNDRLWSVKGKRI